MLEKFLNISENWIIANEYHPTTIEFNAEINAPTGYVDVNPKSCG